MSRERAVRDLAALDRSGSTARMLSLLNTHRMNPDAPELLTKPFFQNPLLNRSIILKHRLRHYEYEAFQTEKTNITKIIVPIDPADLRVGARTVFFGERQFERRAEAIIGRGLTAGSQDYLVLEILDALPSLDPFLLREQLRKIDVEPSRLYFNITEADVTRMFEFARAELSQLARLSGPAGNHMAGNHTGSGRLVEKLLSNTPGGGFLPLKETLQLSDQEYLDGIYAWRGFLYFKWAMGDLKSILPEVLEQIARVRVMRGASFDTIREIDAARARLRDAITKAMASTGAAMDNYNAAFAALTQNGKPAVFREFLLGAPRRFVQLGTELGNVQHIVSFWRYRFPKAGPKAVEANELLDLLVDFETGLGMTPVSA